MYKIPPGGGEGGLLAAHGLLGVEKLLPSDCLNINEFRAIHTNTHSDALEQKLLPKFHNSAGNIHSPSNLLV